MNASKSTAASKLRKRRDMIGRLAMNRLDEIVAGMEITDLEYEKLWRWMSRMLERGGVVRFRSAKAGERTISGKIKQS